MCTILEGEMSPELVSMLTSIQELCPTEVVEVTAVSCAFSKQMNLLSMLESTSHDISFLLGFFINTFRLGSIPVFLGSGLLLPVETSKKI